jgi:hypothetical protein
MKSPNLKKQAGKNSRVKTYLALTAGFVAISPLADAQIIYTDVNPDSVLTGNESFQIDINNDSIMDFKIRHSSLNYQGEDININSFFGLNSNLIFCDGVGSMCSSWHYEPKALNFWDDMTPSGSKKVWKNQEILFRDPPDGCENTGRWKGAKDKYLGLRFKIKGSYYFGWARMDVDSSGKSVTLKDYAYFNEAEKPIRAGSIKVSLPDDDPLKNFRVFSVVGSIRIESPADQTLTGKIRLTDLHGRELKSVDIKNEKTVQLNTQELPTGLYIVNILTEKGSLNKKVLVR